MSAVTVNGRDYDETTLVGKVSIHVARLHRFPDGRRAACGSGFMLTLSSRGTLADSIGVARPCSRCFPALPVGGDPR